VTLTDFACPSNAVPAIRALGQIQFGDQKRKTEDGVTVAASFARSTGRHINKRFRLIHDAKVSDKSGSVTIFPGWSDSHVILHPLLIDIPKVTNDVVLAYVTRFHCLQ
jgi:hypothetical protein